MPRFVIDTPPNKIRSPPFNSQVTPVNKLLEEFWDKNLMESPAIPKAFTHMDTPETPLGAFICPNPSPNLRKEMQQKLDSNRAWKPPPQRRLSTVSFSFTLFYFIL